jgi:hypothetical protein
MPNTISVTPDSVLYEFSPATGTTFRYTVKLVDGECIRCQVTPGKMENGNFRAYRSGRYTDWFTFAAIQRVALRHESQIKDY